ncbi:O-acyltransferase WSD-like [Anopheles aquasalis]|uniref:O-acyltransferase WSD-like n=1 Tax=Anopheles aquasalis TaxID=42839 RepID=UPI00215A6711|nr:O-acyltransferase WSD-like [Anopheles aquasalis]
MSIETVSFFDWANGHGASLWKAIAQNFSHPDAFGPNKPVPATRAYRTVQENRIDLLLSPVQLGFISGLILFMFLKHKIGRWREEHNHLKFSSATTDIRRVIYTLFTFLEFLLLSPLLIIVVLIFKSYRNGVGFVLRKRHGKHFKGLLDGADVVWAIEDQNSRGMINILAHIEQPLLDHNTAISAEILLTLRKRISSRLMRQYQPHSKMFWKRCVELGYYFWSDQSQLTIEDYIRYLDLIPANGDNSFIEESQLRALLSAINNRKLPANHSSSWEVLVGRQPLLNKSNQMLQYPIIFRVHHSLGDGVALMRLLLESIADKEVPTRWKYLSKLKLLNINYILKQTSNVYSICRPKLYLTGLVKRLPSISDIVEQVQRLKRIIFTIYTAPAFFLDVSRRQVDDNCIHSTEIADEKVVSWIHEENIQDNSEATMVDIIKRTKRLLPGARFSDVFLTALSASLEQYFSTRSEDPPQSITVVLPARIEQEPSHLKLQNRFSVALQTLPIECGIDLEDSFRHRNLRNRILAVKRYSDVLRSSSDYMINYWIISKMTCLFPEAILRKILKSAHSTLAISNLPGPQQLPRIQGRELKNLSFFIPNLGTTAVGITLLTYGGKMQLGILADRAVICTEDEAHSILQGTIQELKKMGDLLAEV